MLITETWRCHAALRISRRWSSASMHGPTRAAATRPTLPWHTCATSWHAVTPAATCGRQTGTVLMLSRHFHVPTVSTGAPAVLRWIHGDFPWQAQPTAAMPTAHG